MPRQCATVLTTSAWSRLPIPEQTVESFLLRVLPAVRMKHYTDFYSNWIHHFEIPEPHSYLLIESQSQVITHWPRPSADGRKIVPARADRRSAEH